MKTTLELFKDLSEKTVNKFGFDGGEVEQGSQEWHRMRVAVITGSRVYDIIKPGRKKGSYSEAREKYMNELIAQVCTGLLPDEINAKALSWGKENEPKALDAYDPFGDFNIHQIAFIYSDDMRCGVSPDALVNDEGGLEIKCPFTTSQYINQLLGGDPKPEYNAQYQFCMWIAKRDWWDFMNFDPRMRKNNHIIKRFKKDNEMFDAFEREIPIFISEMDEKLDSIGFKFEDIYK